METLRNICDSLGRDNIVAMGDFNDTPDGNQFALVGDLKQFAGTNSHHIIEGTFKSFGRALKQAVAIDDDYKDEIPSTKGVL